MSQPFATWGFCRHERRAAPARIRLLLAEPVDPTDARAILVHVIAQPTLGDAELRERWKLALQTLLDLDTQYAWGSVKKRAKLVAVAENPVALAGVQAACACGGTVSPSMLAVLAIDGSEASEDAFLPHMEQARTQPGADTWFVRLRKYSTPGTRIDALLNQVDTRIQQRSASSPVLEIAKSLGLEVKDTFWFTLYLSGLGGPEQGNAVRSRVYLSVDSRKHEWLVFSGSVSVTFSDDAPVPTACGPFDPYALPAFLDALAAHQKVQWAWESAHIRSSLRGKKRARLLEALGGPGPTGRSPRK